MANEVERLIKYIRKEDVALFIGSGFSLKAGAPSVWTIIEALNKEANTDLTEGEEHPSLRFISERFVKNYGDRNELISILKRLFTFEVTDTSDQKMLVKIPHIHSIFTTNYDTLIEDAYGKDDRIIVTSNNGCAYTSNVPVCIYKVHGDITTLNDPDRIVITDSDYNGYFTNKQFEFIWKELQQTFVKKHIVFIGYGMEDTNILEIVKTVRDCIGNNMKTPFVVAPDFDNNKRYQLKANNISYINSKAENVLDAVHISLNDHIVSDHKHKLISTETYDRYCELNAGLFSTTTNKGKINSIDNVQVKKGYTKQEKINFTIPNSIREHIENGIFNDKLPIKGTGLFTPAYKISASDMSSFEYRINDILFSSKEDIKSVWVAAQCHQHQMKIKVPSIGFNELVTAYGYSLNQELCVNIETPIYILHCHITINDENGYSLKVDVEAKNQYDNISDALKWNELLIAMFSGDEIWVNNKHSHGEKNDDAVKEYNKHKQYYNLLQAIELETDIVFLNYRTYSKNNFIKAKYLLNYYKQQPCIIETEEEPSLTAIIDIRKDGAIPIEQLSNNDFCIVKTSSQESFTLNEKEFVIPFLTTILDRCYASDIKKIDEYNYEVKMVNRAKQYAAWCSNTPPREDGNVLHLDDKLS